MKLDFEGFTDTDMDVTMLMPTMLMSARRRSIHLGNVNWIPDGSYKLADVYIYNTSANTSACMDGWQLHLDHSQVVMLHETVELLFQAANSALTLSDVDIVIPEAAYDYNDVYWTHLEELLKRSTIK
jgi:hypothetical protein